MIRTSVIPYLSSGLAKNSKIMSMFALFSQLFWSLSKFGFSQKLEGGGGGGLDKPYTKAVKQDIFSQFFKSTAKVTFFSIKPGYLTKT